MITIGQQDDSGGMASVTPPGWQRLFEHSPVDTSPYQGWFALELRRGEHRQLLGHDPK